MGANQRNHIVVGKHKSLTMKVKFQVFIKDVDKDMLLLLAARASRVENQDAIDACVVGMLGDPKEVNHSLLAYVNPFHFFVDSFHFRSYKAF